MVAPAREHGEVGGELEMEGQLEGGGEAVVVVPDVEVGEVVAAAVHIAPSAVELCADCVLAYAVVEFQHLV